MKKVMTMVLSLFLGVALYGCNSETTTTTTGLNYEMFDYIEDYDEIFDRRQGTYLVYIYSPSCTVCESIKDTVLEFADTYTAHEIYFLDVTNASSTAETEFLSLIGLSSTVFGTPSLVIVVDNDFDKTAFSHYFFAGGTEIPAVIRDIQNGAYQYF